MYGTVELHFQTLTEDGGPFPSPCAPTPCTHIPFIK